MEDLSKLRQDIDRIDRQIVELFEERMGVSHQVAEYKIANGKKVLDRARELEKLETLGNLTNDSFNRHGIQELFQQIMAMSRISVAGRGRSLRKPSIYKDRPY